MKKVGSLLLMIILSSNLYAPKKPEPFYFQLPITIELHEQKTKVLVFYTLENLIEELKSSETWHDSLSYKHGNPYKKVNNIGAMGAWQFMPETLRFLGYKGSFNKFLNSENLQRTYISKLILVNIKLLCKKSKKYGVLPVDSIGRTINGVEITLPGLLAASHLAGAGGVYKFLARRGNPTDGYASVKTYLLKFKSNNMDSHFNPKSYDAYRLLHEGALAFSKAEQQGFRVDLEYVVNKRDNLTKKIAFYENIFRESELYKGWQKASKSTVNIHSGPQLANYLYNVLGIEPKKLTETGKGATDDEALQQLDIPELNKLLYVRKLKKVRDTYLEAFYREQVDGVIHPMYNLHLVRTFRSSSDSPNFQNLPKRDEEAMNIVRKALFAREGNQLLEVDFSGAEVRIAACYHKDQTMLNYIKDPSSDMHADMATQIFKLRKLDKKIPEHNTLRQAAKNGFVFPQFYGDYYKNCAVNMACTWGKLPQGKWKPGQGIEYEGKHLSDHLILNGFKSLDSFTDHMKTVEDDFWGNRFKHYAWWKDAWWDNYKKYGFIEMYTGFRCYGVMSRNDAINYPVQGSAFHCMLWSFIEMTKLLEKYNFNTKLIGQIHDSMIFDTDPKEVKDVWEMVHEVVTVKLPKAWDWIIVPLEIDAELSPVGGSWAEKSKFKV